MSELSELFARDPLSLSDQDIDTIVKRMREARAQFELGLKAPVGERPKAKKSTKELMTASLKDLGL